MSQTDFIIQTAAARMPVSCWGKYRRVGILEVDAGINSVSMISKRAKGVIRVVETWEKLFVGSSSRCAFEKALKAAEDKVTELRLEKINNTL